MIWFKVKCFRDGNLVCFNFIFWNYYFKIFFVFRVNVNLEFLVFFFEVLIGFLIIEGKYVNSKNNGLKEYVFNDFC